MFAPRSRFDENALVSQTPGPSMNRSRVSPIKQHGMTTAGKQRVKSQIEDGGLGMGSPRKLFKEAGGGRSPQKGASGTPGPSSKRPMALGPKTPAGGLRSALGDKTNNTNKASINPFMNTTQRSQLGERGAQLTGKSPKRTDQGSSPLKSTQKPMIPQTPAGSSSMTAKDKSYTTLPSVGPKPPSGGARGVKSFETPAANVGRKGMMKQKMGEMLDAQRFASAGVEPPEQCQEEDAQQHWADGLTEEEMYPDIEYMPPPSAFAIEREERPEAMEGLMNAAQLGAMMGNPNFLALGRLSPPRSASQMSLTNLDDEAAALDIGVAEINRRIDEESTDDDEPYPDDKVLVPVKSEKAFNGGSSRTRVGTPTSSASRLSGQSTTALRVSHVSTESRPPGPTVLQRPCGQGTSSVNQTKKSSTLINNGNMGNARLVATSRAASSKPSTSRSGSTNSTIQSAPRGRPALSSVNGTSTSSNRPISSKTQVRPTSVSRPTHPTTTTTKTMKMKRQPHPALLNLENDGLSQMVKEQIVRDEEEQLRELGICNDGLDLFDVSIDAVEELGV